MRTAGVKKAPGLGSQASPKFFEIVGNEQDAPSRPSPVKNAPPGMDEIGHQKSEK